MALVSVADMPSIPPTLLHLLCYAGCSLLCLRLPTANRACSVCAWLKKWMPQSALQSETHGMHTLAPWPLVDKLWGACFTLNQFPAAPSGNLIDNTFLIDVLSFPVFLSSIPTHVSWVHHPNEPSHSNPCLRVCSWRAKTKIPTYFWGGKVYSLNKGDAWFSYF